MENDDDLEEWARIRRNCRAAQIRNYLNPEVNTTTEASVDLFDDDENVTTYEPHRNIEYSLTPENRHERRKAEAIARKNSKPRSNNANYRSNRKSRKW